jgi:hypothetical protein
MIYPKIRVVLSALTRPGGVALLSAIVLLAVPAKPSAAQTPAPKPAAKTTTSHPSSASTAADHPTNAHPTGNAGGKPAEPAHNTAGTTRNPNGTLTVHTAKGAEITKSPDGRVESFKSPAGHEARFDSKGRVREVHAAGMTVSRGPGGMRRTVFDRPDHARLVAYGHGRGYIQHPFTYGGHTYYSRAYYYHGSYYRAYYHPYYYHGVYLHGYIPAYYYPPAYYGWAYNPWLAPVPYAWGWAGNPWYGYYGAYFVPYPAYPSAAYWIADYLIAASLAEAYASATASAQGDSAQLPSLTPARLIYASYDPDTGTTSPTMTKEVKDAIAEEIKRELAASQNLQDPASGNTASLATLLADAQPHVFVVNTGVSVASAGQDCGLTEGDVLALSKPPAQEATTADLRVLASKQNDCAIGDAVSVELTDLQEMQNHLLSNIDSAMAEMKDHPGQGGLPAPPAETIQGTKEAPYAAAAPAADPNGAAELDQTAQQGTETEKQVVAEATSPDDSNASAPPTIGGVAPESPSPPSDPSAPIVIALGQTEAQVISGKGQPTNKVAFPNKTVFIYPDMKITFVDGKVSDVQ